MSMNPPKKRKPNKIIVGIRAAVAHAKKQKVVKAKTYECRRCRGSGQMEEPRDMHRSGGIVPCTWCGGSGRVTDKKLANE